MPTASIEEWRYSKIDDLDLNQFLPLQVPYEGSNQNSLLVSGFIDTLQSPVVINSKNGAIEYSGDIPRGLSIENDDPGDISHNFSGADVFYDINALLSNPISLKIEATYDKSRPIVVFRHFGGDNLASFPNLCVRVEEKGEVQIVEVLVSSDESNILVLPVTKIFQKPDSKVEYLAIQDLGSKTQMIGHQISRLMEHANFNSLSVVSGGDYSRIFTTSTISGVGATSNLNASYFGSGDQVLDFRTLQEHSAKNGRSELYFKGAAANEAHLVYSGLIKVDKGATSTDAFQTNKNLVLSEGARADSVPNLDIQENDVRCSHASSVGPIDVEQKYYLESRGISPEVVQKLIVSGFFAEMANRSSIPGVDKVLSALAARKWEAIQ